MTGRTSPKDVGEYRQWQAFYNLKQVLFSFVVDHEVSKPSQFLAISSGIAACGDNQGARVSLPGPPEPVAGLTVGYMGDRAGIDNVNICTVTR